MSWKTSKKMSGLQVSTNEKGQKIYRLKSKVKGKFVIDYFGMIQENDAIKFASILKSNRKSGIGVQTFKEMKSKASELKQAQIIVQEKEVKQILKEKAFNNSNTVSTYFYSVYWDRASEGRTETTNKNMLASIKKWIIKYLGDIPLAELSRENIENMLKAMKKEKNSPRNIQYVFNMLQHIYNDAQLHFEDINPLPPFKGNKIKLEAVNNEKICFLDKQEAYNLLNLLYNWQEYCQENKIRIKKIENVKDAYGLALISLLTGLRFSSIANLKWQDINNSLAYIRTTKNKKSIAVNVENKLIQDMLNKRQKLSSEDYIFTNSNNQPYKQPPRIFYKAIKILKLNEAPHRLNNQYEKIDFHALRHTYASWLAQSKVNSFELKELMGHSTLKMTERYARLNPEAVQKNTVALAESFSNFAESQNAKE